MNYRQYVINQVSEEDLRKLQESNIVLDSGILAGLWPDFVNFEKRRRTEIPFILEKLAGYKNPRVFDATLGSGATAIGLKLAGVEEVVGNEIEEDMIKVAKNEAKRYGVCLNLASYDWRGLDEYFETFDAVLCLGNSLTYLFKKKDQIRALENFRKILRPNGVLIIDERNYAEHFLKGNYRFSGDVVYCGKERVCAHPIFISENMVVMEYEHIETGKKAHLVLYPFKEGELGSLLKEAGFGEIKVYGDYKKEFDAEEPEFLTYVCRK